MLTTVHRVSIYALILARSWYAAPSVYMHAYVCKDWPVQTLCSWSACYVVGYHLKPQIHYKQSSRQGGQRASFFLKKNVYNLRSYYKGGYLFLLRRYTYIYILFWDLLWITMAYLSLYNEFKRSHAHVPFQFFAAGVLTCMLYTEFIRRAEQVYTMLPTQNELASKAACEALLCVRTIDIAITIVGTSGCGCGCGCDCGCGCGCSCCWFFQLSDSSSSICLTLPLHKHTRTHAHAHRLSAIQPGKRRRPHYSHPPSTYPLPRRKTQTRWHELWQPQALLQKAAATMQASHYQISCNQPQGYLWYCSARNVRAHLRQHVRCLSMYPWKFKYTNEIN